MILILIVRVFFHISIESLNLTVDVYYNFHKDCFSIRFLGIVIWHAKTVTLRDVKLIVSDAGRKYSLYVLKRKSVHAYARGVLVAVNDDFFELCLADLCCATYNRLKVDSFAINMGTSEQAPVYQVDWCVLANKAVWFKKSELSKENSMVFDRPPTRKTPIRRPCKKIRKWAIVSTPSQPSHKRAKKIPLWTIVWQSRSPAKRARLWTSASTSSSSKQSHNQAMKVIGWTIASTSTSILAKPQHNEISADSDRLLSNDISPITHDHSDVKIGEASGLRSGDRLQAETAVIAENLGRLFEVGFNIGILAYIEQNQIPHNFGDLYRRELQHLKFPEMLDRLKKAEKELISTENIQIIDTWSLFFLQKGFLSGLNFFGEYIQSLDTRNPVSPRNPVSQPPIEILYFQCRFCEDNSMGTYPKDEQREVKDLLSQFPDLTSVIFEKRGFLQYLIKQYSSKGEFFKADTLMLLRHRQQFRILSVDLSVFSVKSNDDLLDLKDKDLEHQRRLLLRDVNYLRSKSVFSKLRIDTGAVEDLGFAFSENLKEYFTAFKRKDKESAKLIQAASYAHSFYHFLREMGILQESDDLVFNVVGYSDRGLSAMSLRPKNLDVLATCAEIYKNERKQQEINRARRKVLETIKQNAAKSFKNGKEFVENLSTKPLSLKDGGIAEVIHNERIDDFLSSVAVIPPEIAAQLDIDPTLHLRNAHAHLIRKALVSDDTYIFLTGNPGIGKTTAIANFLKDNADDGFLFFYVSPRKQVNFDIIDKFKTGDELCDNRIFCINTNSIIIKENGGRPTVQYLNNVRSSDFTENAVTFLDARNAKNPVSPKNRVSHRLRKITEDRIRDVGTPTSGVLASICDALHAVIDRQISNNLVATVAIQSLRMTPNGDNTLRHLDNIFKTAFNKREGAVIPSKMLEISKRIKHLFIMIDEITGDDSGAEFLNGISRFLSKYKLTDSRYGFNTKVIVADASLVNSKVIEQHLKEASPEPDKIFFRKVEKARFSKKPSLRGERALEVEPFQFKRLPATIINANSYPASSLNITYKVFIGCLKFNESDIADKKNYLLENTQGKIINDIEAILNYPEANQVLVYIQNKKKLQSLIEKIQQRWGKFEKNKDYLEIHANLSEADKQTIGEYKHVVKVVFMTSSASRGLSFPRAKHILVEIPRFQIESNLMEVIQVIYRARGEYSEAGQTKTLDAEDKELIFYLSDWAVYYPNSQQLSPEDYVEERKLSVQESVLSLLNILLILKASVMTRIAGAGLIGKDYFLMIPIGGKSVSAAGDTFTGKMTHLIRELKNEHNRKPSNQGIKEVYQSLEQLLSGAEFTLWNNISESRVQGTHLATPTKDYLRLLEFFNREFAKLCSSLDRLLDCGNIEPGIISGSLLIVPIHNQRLEETYEIRLQEQIRKYATNELLEKLRAISYSKQYPENLQSAIREGAIELVDLLEQEDNRTQWFEQNSHHPDQYYALPLFAFITGEAMSEYFKHDGEAQTEEDSRFRNILSRYIHSLYPAYSTLPIGRNYAAFPFLVFRSYSLEEMRQKIFTDKYLLTSNELNVLNLILSTAT